MTYNNDSMSQYRHDANVRAMAKYRYSLFSSIFIDFNQQWQAINSAHFILLFY
jgi:hypothetical protein